MVNLTRKVRFSSGHRYWSESLSPEANRARFGKWASPYNHGHNYVLEVTIRGEVDPTHGMVVNIKQLDDLLQDRVVQRFDQRSINDEIPFFRETSPCLENLLLYLFEELFESKSKAKIEGVPVEVVDLQLEEMPGLWANLSGSKQMTITRTFEFAASHRLHLPYLSGDENRELFGKCNNEAGHGHNYLLEVTVGGSPDPETGFLVNLTSLETLVEEAIVARYDHKNLSVDLPEFTGKNATTEVVVEEIFARLAPLVAESLNVKLVRARLHETERSSFEVSAH